MTREEAIKILQGAIKKPNTEDGYLGQAPAMAIKALKQEPILDKIRAEIEQLPTYLEYPNIEYITIKKQDLINIIDKAIKEQNE